MGKKYTPTHHQGGVRQADDPANSWAMEAVQYMKAQAVPVCPYVFATQTGKHLSYRHLLATMETACEAAGVEHRGLHALRPSFATDLYARGRGSEDHLKAPGPREHEKALQPAHPLLEGEIDDTLRQAVGM